MRPNGFTVWTAFHQYCNGCHIHFRTLLVVYLRYNRPEDAHCNLWRELQGKKWQNINEVTYSNIRTERKAIKLADLLFLYEQRTTNWSGNRTKPYVRLLTNNAELMTSIKRFRAYFPFTFAMFRFEFIRSAICTNAITSQLLITTAFHLLSIRSYITVKTLIANYKICFSSL